MSRSFFTRSSYVPAGAREFTFDHGVAYLYESSQGKRYAIGFRGRAQSPSFHYSFRSDESRTEFVNAWADKLIAMASDSARRRAERSQFVHTLKVGDVLMSMWGYDQTNIDYYQVTKLIGKRQVEIRQIARQSEGTLSMQGISVPNVSTFIGEPMRKLVGERNQVKVSSCAYASPLEYTEVAGVRCYTAHTWTAYA